MVYSIDGDTLTGYVDSGTTPGVLDALDRRVFTLSVDPLGNGLFKLFDNLDHNGGPELLPIDLSLAVEATDGDGDTITLDTGQLVFEVRRSTGIQGTDVDDVIVGTADNDEIYGLSGNDTLTGAAGNDILDGGDGDDIYNFGNGDGQDVIVPGNGADRIIFGAGIDAGAIAFVRQANDLLAIVSGSDQVRVLSWFDANVNRPTFELHDGTALGVLDLRVEGTSDDDFLEGGTGNDVIVGGAGADQLSGGDGSDILDGGEGSDVLNGGDGVDTADYSGASGAVEVDLAAGSTLEADLSTDVLTNIENAIGSSLADTLIGSEGINILTGGAGDDTLEGGLGNDTLIGGLGDDTYQFNLGDAQDTIVNSDSNLSSTDTLSFGAGIVSDNLWFAQSSNDLVVSLLGTTDRVTVAGWYSNDASKIDEFVDGTGETLNRSEIDQLVSAMAAFSPSDGTGSGGVEPGAVPNDVQLAIDSAWQPPSA